MEEENASKLTKLDTSENSEHKKELEKLESEQDKNDYIDMVNHKRLLDRYYTTSKYLIQQGSDISLLSENIKPLATFIKTAEEQHGVQVQLINNKLKTKYEKWTTESKLSEEAKKQLMEEYEDIKADNNMSNDFLLTNYFDVWYFDI